MIILAILVIVWASGVQPTQRSEIALLQTVQLGDNVTIKCFLTTKHANTIVWYKQSIGKMPRAIALSFNYLTKIRFMDEFKNGRFTISASEKSFHLNITAITKEDTGIYYCGTAFLNHLEFISGAYLMTKGTESKDFNIEQQPELLPVSQGDNVNIQCKILIESCAEDHSVYWFRHGATEFHQGILYIQSGGHGQCKRSAEAGSKTRRCVYDLFKRNISLSDVGIYYCAIAACGEIMLGNGTTLKHTDNANQNVWDPLFLSLISSNVVFLIVTVTLLVDLCKNRRKRHRGSTKASTSQSCETGDFLNYAAVSFVPIPSSSRRTRGSNNRDLTEYSEVHYKLRDQMP